MPMLAWEASWGWVALLLGTGVLLSIAELFIPSYGALTLLAVLSFLVAILVAFMKGQGAGVATLLGVLILAPLLIYTLLRAWPHLPMAKRLILRGPVQAGKAGDLAHLNARELTGRIGMSKTQLRPSGKMVIDGQQIDCMTEGGLIPSGRKVRIIDVQGAKVVVRLLDDEPTT